MNKQVVTDWTSYYSEKKSIWSAYTQKSTFEIIKKTVHTYFDKNESIKVIELGGGNSCFVAKLVNTCNIERYDILENNDLASNLFEELELNIEHCSIRKDILVADEECEHGRYDFCFSVGLIEHFEDNQIKNAIDRHFEYVDKGGIVLITFPTPTIKYRLIRKIMEVIKKWQFWDETPLKFDDVKDVLTKRADILYKFINRRLFLTQYVVILKKR